MADYPLMRTKAEPRDRAEFVEMYKDHIAFLKPAGPLADSGFDIKTTLYVSVTYLPSG